MSTSEMLGKVLSDLGKIGEIEASAIATRDGLLMNADMHVKGDPETFVAMSATMLGAAETATSELNKGIPNRVIVETDDGKLVCMGAGPKALVVVLTAPEAGLGLILVELTKAAEKIKKLI
ncbi:roadblock/LC7 domain-containing protein [ANME-2 cluster archaeon]|nr:MAG: roadblock/LC7 domain-containing protein [ANME-2 cluster archaeon]RLG24647.1 MAG: roadblock/LC7 domain-containing protein [Methanosarcinales archaeon]